MNSVAINSLGLIFDIIGALMLWYFVVEINYADKIEFLKGNAVIDLKDPTPEQISSYRRKMLLARVGAVLLVSGFVLQLPSNYMV